MPAQKCADEAEAFQNLFYKTFRVSFHMNSVISSFTLLVDRNISSFIPRVIVA